MERSEVSSRKFEGLAEANGVLAGTLEGPVPIKLNGLRFEVDVLGGHKTGLYLDQQVNYQRVAELAKGAQVLDCFSFLGGFGLHAARAGAAHVHLLDQSAEAIAAATRNAAANDLAEKCSAEAANVFDWLKAQTVTQPHEKVVPRWDLIVLDPPSFTRNRASVPDALRGYKEIHLRALKLLKTRRDAGDLLLLAPRGCRTIPGHRPVRRVRCPANSKAHRHLFAVPRPPDYPDDPRDGVSEGICV